MDKEDVKRKIIEILSKTELNLNSILGELNKEGIVLSYGTLRLYVMELLVEGKVEIIESRGRGSPNIVRLKGGVVDDRS